MDLLTQIVCVAIILGISIIFAAAIFMAFCA